MINLKKLTAAGVALVLASSWGVQLNSFNVEAASVPVIKDPLPAATDRLERKVVIPIKVRAKRNPSPSRSMAYAKSQMKKWRWHKSQMKCLRTLWMNESGWSHTADNPNSSAYGIPQALPASKMSVSGKDYMTNPVTQINWGLKYIKVRYDSPCKALNHYNQKNWY
jgi:hypothetical protein